MLKGAAISGFKAFAKTLIPGLIGNTAVPLFNYKTDGTTASLVPISQTWVKTPTSLTVLAPGIYSFLHIDSRLDKDMVTRTRNLRFNGAPHQPIVRYVKGLKTYEFYTLPLNAGDLITFSGDIHSTKQVVCFQELQSLSQIFLNLRSL